MELFARNWFIIFVILVRAFQLDASTLNPTEYSNVFQYTGSPATYVVPSGVDYLTIEACGAQGGGLNSRGGLGGRVRATVSVTPGSNLVVVVGGSGFTNKGYNGGGAGAAASKYGGGATQIGKSRNADLIVVAGAGGGTDSSSYSGGHGGGSVGQSGQYLSSSGNGQGGSLTAGGLNSVDSCTGVGGFLKGGNCTTGGGGGAGLYGGGGGYWSAGGGSSYINPIATTLLDEQGSSLCTGDGVLFISTSSSPSAFPTYMTPTVAPSITTSPTTAMTPNTLTVDGHTKMFSYTGSNQTYIVPSGIYSIQVDACGAQGLGGLFEGIRPGGLGGYIRAIISVTPAQILYVYIGGGECSLPYYTCTSYNGGGVGSYSPYGGGGSVDIRSGWGGVGGGDSLYTRLVVAGGGGGGTNGGGGGGLNGERGLNEGGLGGTQSIGGAGEIGSYDCGTFDKNGAVWSGGACGWLVSGGGGWYGGGAGNSAGGGGSSYSNGTILINTRGDDRCTSSGKLYITEIVTGTAKPTKAPTSKPTGNIPTVDPTRAPTISPSVAPTRFPTAEPTAFPTILPTTAIPSPMPSGPPTTVPTARPSALPTPLPSFKPSAKPSAVPSAQPTNPTGQPTSQPTLQPSGSPTGVPTQEPSFSLQTNVAFNVTQLLNGVTESDWNNDVNARTAFKRAIAASINSKATTPTNAVNIDSSAVRIVSVLSISRRRDLTTGSGSVHLTGTGIRIIYELTVTNQQLGQKNPTSAYAAAVAAVTAATSDATSSTPATLQTQLQAALSSLGSSSGIVNSILVDLSTPSAAVYTIAHSAKPTGQPTSKPSSVICPAGYRHNPNGPHCYICPAGTYSSAGSYSCIDCPAGTAAGVPGTGMCSQCELGYYATNKKSLSCSQCPWPYTNIGKGYNECAAIEIHLTNSGIAAFLSFAFVLYCSCVYLTKNPSLAMFTILPALDVVSDILYLLQTRFYNVGLMITCIIFIFAPCSIFVHTLYDEEALVPHILLPVPEFLEDNSLLWLSIHGGQPFYHRSRIEWLSYDRLDTIPKLIGYWIIMIGLVASQGICGAVQYGIYSLYMLFHIPFSIIWLVFGFFLHSIKMMCVGQVWTFWFRVWRRRDLMRDIDTGKVLRDEKGRTKGRHDSNVTIATDIMNESLFAEFITETCPQMIIQGINNQLTGKWSDVAYFSTSFSVFMAINGLYRYVYYTQFAGFAFNEIPITITIGTKTIELPLASHKKGVQALDYEHLKTDEVIAREIDKDRRFIELVELLGKKNAEHIRDPKRYNPKRVHLFGKYTYIPPLDEDEEENDEKDGIELTTNNGTDERGVSNDESAPDESSSVSMKGASVKAIVKQRRKSFAVALSNARVKLSDSIHAVRSLLNKSKSGDNHNQQDWLDDLDHAVAEYEEDQLPVMNDLRVYKLVKILKDNRIVNEKHLRSVLLIRHTDEARLEFVKTELGVRSKLYHLILQSFFSRLWERLVSEGKDSPDYVYEGDEHNLWTVKQGSDGVDVNVGIDSNGQIESSDRTSVAAAVEAVAVDMNDENNN